MHPCCSYQEREGALADWQARLDRRQAELKEQRAAAVAATHKREAELDAKERELGAMRAAAEERRRNWEAEEARGRQVRHCEGTDELSENNAGKGLWNGIMVASVIFVLGQLDCGLISMSPASRAALVDSS